MSKSKKPNFLFIITDQLRADYLSCAGHPVLKTPNIDAIAENGTRFNRFYVSNPVCMPNRATMMTGRMPSLHGVRHNGIPLDLRANTFVELMKDDGYRTALIGKSHLQNMTSDGPEMTRTFDEREGEFGEAVKPGPEAPEDYDGELPSSWAQDDYKLKTPFYGFDHVKLTTLHADRVGGEYKHWLKSHRPDADSLIGPENALPHDYTCPQAWRTAVPEELYSTSYIEQESIAYLENHAQSGGDDPFFLMMSFPDPHHPFTPPGKYWDMYDPADMVLPESFHKRGNQPPPTAAWAYENRIEGKANRGAGQVLFVVDEKETREAMALTCGMIAMIDDAIGSVTARMKALGLDEDTIVVFTSDHGDFMGDHRLMLKGPLHYQGLIKTPFIWSDPKNTNKGTVTESISGMIDVANTILDRADITPYNGIQGRSLLPEALEQKASGPGFALVEDDQQRKILSFDDSFRVHTLVTEQWRMSVFSGADWGEMYDLHNDPAELQNLWDSPEHADVKSDLLAQFVRAKIDLVDRSPFPTAIA